MKDIEPTLPNVSGIEQAIVDCFRRYWIGGAGYRLTSACDAGPGESIRGSGSAALLGSVVRPSCACEAGTMPTPSFSVRFVMGTASVLLDVPPGPCRLGDWKRDSHQKEMVVHVFSDRAQLAKLKDFPWGDLGWIVAEPEHLIAFD